MSADHTHLDPARPNLTRRGFLRKGAITASGVAAVAAAMSPLRQLSREDLPSLEQFLPACLERGISVIVGGPYNSGILASEPSPGARYDYAAAAPEILARALALHRVCESHGVPLPAAALQFPLLHPAVAAVRLYGPA